jgi:hypothetical protein
LTLLCATLIRASRSRCELDERWVGDVAGDSVTLVAMLASLLRFSVAVYCFPRVVFDPGGSRGGKIP